MKPESTFLSSLLFLPVSIILSFLLLFHPSMFAETEPETIDNTASLEHLDKQIAELVEKYQEGESLLNRLKGNIPKYKNSAKSLLHAEQELEELHHRVKIEDQNNRMKIVAQLGLSIAFLGSTALNPASTFIDAAATGINLLVTDPLMNEVFKWMGVDSPMKKKKQTLLTLADGTFPSQPMLENWLEQKPGDNHAILHRSKMIMQHAKAGVKEVRAAKKAMLAECRRSEGLVSQMHSKLVELKLEIERLKRLRARTAGEIPEEFTPEPYEPERLQEMDSDLGDAYQSAGNMEARINAIRHLRAEIKGKRRELNEVRNSIVAQAKLITEKAEKEAREIEDRFLAANVELPVYNKGTPSGTIQGNRSTLERETGRMEVSLTTISRREAALPDSTRDLNPVWLSELEKNGLPGSTPIRRAMKDRDKFLTILNDWEEKYMAALESSARCYEQGVQKLKSIKDLKSRKTEIMYGELKSLIEANKRLIEEFEQDYVDSPITRYIDTLSGLPLYPSVPDAERLFGSIEQYINSLASRAQYLQSTASKRRHELAIEDEKRKKETPVMKSLIKVYLEQARDRAEIRIEQTRERLTELDNFFATVKDYTSLINALAKRGILDIQQIHGQGTFMLSAEWLDAHLADQSSLCKPLIKLESELAPAVIKLERLKTKIDNWRISPPSELRDPVIAQNMPGLQSDFDELNSRITKVREKWQQSQKSLQPRMRTDLFTFYEALQKKHPVLLPRAKPQSTNLSKLMKALQRKFFELQDQVEILQKDIERNARRDRIPSTLFPDCKDAIARIKKEYEQQLACLGPDHDYCIAVVEALPQLEQSLEKLKGKPTYLNAGGVINDLETGLKTIKALHLSDDQDYRDAVARTEEELKQQTQWLQKNEGNMIDTQVRRITELLNKIETQLQAHREHLKMLDFLAGNPEIEKFYENFRQAYQRQNEARLLACLDDDWSAGDGTTLYDVEDYFRNMFNVFDEIRVDIRGLNIEALDSNRYRVSYQLRIVGMIFDTGIEHEEQSTVTEEVQVDASGKIRIMRTPQGRFWQAQ